MQICTLASSSSGNCTLVTEGQTHILIDAGISMRRIKAGLMDLGIDPASLSAIVVTHEHTDHISGIKMMNKYYKTPLIMPETVAKGVSRIVPELCGDIACIPVGDGFDIGDLHIKCFHTPHDTEESVGYKFTNGDRTFALATDLGHVTEEVLTELTGVDAAVLEANHDPEMLKNGVYPYFLKKRVLSDYGHLSNRLCGLLAGRLFENGAEKIVLAHLSRENNTPGIAYSTVKSGIMKAGGAPGENMELYLASPDVSGPLIEV